MSNIPQEVLDHYNRNYRNGTYTAFGTRLKYMTADDAAHGDTFEQMVMNLLIDAALERSGAAFYNGAERSLMRLIRPVLAEKFIRSANNGPRTPLEVEQRMVEATGNPRNLSCPNESGGVEETGNQQLSAGGEWRTGIELSIGRCRRRRTYPMRSHRADRDGCTDGLKSGWCSSGSLLIVVMQAVKHR
jgi:hypothetical protein